MIRIILNFCCFFIGMEILLGISFFTGIGSNINLIGIHPRTFDYIQVFLFIIATLYAILQVVFYKLKLHQLVKYLAFYLIWFLLAVFFCGLSYSLLDIQCESSLSGVELFSKLMIDQKSSFVVGGKLFLTFIPFNIIVIALSYILLWQSKLFVNKNNHKKI